MSIDEYRKKIDSIDENIIHLLTERVKCAEEIGKIKKSQNLPIFVPSREKAILERLVKINPEFPPSLVRQIFKEIISYSRSREYPLKIAFLGPEGSYSHQAVVHYFASSVFEKGCHSITDVFLDLEKEESDFGIVPIENSYNGVVFPTMDGLMDFNLQIIGELYLRIRHTLLSNEKDMKKIKRIYSHPQSLEQCKMFLNKEFPGIEKIEVASNSKAALIASKEKKSAAIAGSLCSELYKIDILASNIEDAVDNYTRFIVLGKTKEYQKNGSKTSLMISIADKPGTLDHILRAFAEKNINLTKIESRPSKRKAWDYVFFIDLDGNIEEERVKVAISEIQEKTLYVKILGSYPKGEFY
ncbi:MAG TPA: prephenate dehydratase [Spirochaetia bacterium]|nr:MAG: chorismate mutase [Spirochaetes bacterium GWB1_36_13]HCL56794.1 prephenate dehydratase [Spirochaetia bacterium]